MSEQRATRRWGQSLIAVFLGMVTVVALSVGADMAAQAAGWSSSPHTPDQAPQFIVAAIYRAAFTLLGGYVTARLAPDRPMGHAWILAGIGLIAGMAGLIAYWQSAPELGPAWYAISIPASAAPCTGAGAYLWVRQLRQRSLATATAQQFQNQG